MIRSTLNYCANTGLAWSKVTSSQAVFTLMSGNGTASRSHPARRRPPNYLHALPMMLNGRVRLLDNPALRLSSSASSDMCKLAAAKP